MPTETPAGFSSQPSPASPWTESANWTVGAGSLRETISYDCSSALDDPDEKSNGVLLLKPGGSDPCEVTVCFREKHEIHRIYVRSSARVYEIYYAPEEPRTNNEYLATVHCGASMTEVVLPKINEGEVVLESHRLSKQNSHLPRNDINDEDGWIEVKSPECQTSDDREELIPGKTDGTAASDVQVCFEATAEISDANPCISVTLRLLSIQSKCGVYIDEIYICANPIGFEANNPGQSSRIGNDLSGSSLLAMLVPGILQISKNETSGRPDSCIFPKSSGEDSGVDNKEKYDSEFVKEKISGETSHYLPNPDSGEGEAPHGLKVAESQSHTSLKMPVESTSCNPVSDVEYKNVEKVLDELVSRVGRIEGFCLRFEENIMKPLGSMEARLQKMENQLDTLSTRPCCHETFSAPESSLHKSDLEKKEYNASDAHHNPTSNCQTATECSAVPDFASKVNPGLIVTAPEFPQDDDFLTSSISCVHSADKNLSEDKISDEGCEYHCDSDCYDIYNAQSTVKNGMEDNATLNRAPGNLCIDECLGYNDNLDPKKRSSSKAERSISIESALTSALEAFMSSATSKSSCQYSLPNEHEDEGKYESVEAPPGFHCEDAEKPGIYHSISQDTAPEDCVKSREYTSDKSCTETTSDIFSHNHFHMQSNDKSCSTSQTETVGFGSLNNEPKEEGQTPGDGLIYRNWIIDSDSESSADEGAILDKNLGNWIDRSSTDSGNEDFLLGNWLAAQEVQHSLEEIHKTSCDQMTCSTFDDAWSNTLRSKVDMERALKSTFLDDCSFTRENLDLEETNEASFLAAMLDKNDNLNDSGTECKESHSFSPHNLDPVALMYEDQFLVDVQELSSIINPVNDEEETVQVPPLRDNNKPAFPDHLLVDAGDFFSISISSNIEGKTSVYDHELPFTGLI